jgi:Fe-S oxidoreductase
MLDRAKRLWRETLDSLRPEIEAGTPLVGLEPACLAAFRDELPNLFPDDPLAERLSRQSLFLTEFLDQHARGAGLPRIDGKALVHVHCHQHAVIGVDAEKKVLDRLGLDYRMVSSGCCGMAGAFGFEADKVEVSRQAAERVLLPEVRRADQDTRIVTNGFSCREQIEQGTGRATLHVAELIAGALGKAP